MSLFATLKDLKIERKKLHDQNSQILIKAAKEKRSMTKEENAEFDARDADIAERCDKEIERLQKQLEREQFLSEVRNDSRTAGREDLDPRAQTRAESAEAQKAVSLAYRAWMREGNAGLSQEQRQVLSGRTVADLPQEVRAQSAISGPGGAYTIPTGFANKIDVALKAFGGMIDEADTIPTEMGNDFPYPSINDTSNTGEVSQENQGVGGSDTNATAEQDPAYGVTTLRAYTIDSTIVRVPITLIQDSAFDVENMFANDLLKTRLGRRINNKLTLGTGANEPTGIVTAAPSGVTTASNSAFTYNELISLFHSVDPLYRPGAKWMFNDSTLLAIKKLADSSGRPLFIAGGVSEGIQNKEPDTINGAPYTINQDMPSIGSATTPIIFGQLKKYKYRKVRDYQMVRFGERFMDKLQIGFLLWLRIDGNLVDAGTHPVKLMTMHV